MHSSNLITKVVISDVFNPWYNLALEEYLLEEIKENEVCLYLWQNENTVVIGRNQNPWKEVRLKLLEEDNGKLARRLSGGGAVYQDLGNLNFTFIMHKNLYDLDKQLKVIIDSLRAKGIDAEFTGRNDITVLGRKVSGNAYYHTETKSYHHGTILVNANLDKLTNYLQVSKEKIISKGIDSIRSRVINLKDVNPRINIEDIIESLIKGFHLNYGGDLQKVKIDNNPRIKELYAKYSSRDWLYGETPSFDLILSNKFNWGSIELGFKYEDGEIVDCKIFSDSLAPDLIDKISSRLKNIPFDMKKIIGEIKTVKANSIEEEEIINNLTSWLNTKIKDI